MTTITHTRPRTPHYDAPDAVGLRILNARLDAGLSQRDLAFPGCTPCYLSRMERGERVAVPPKKPRRRPWRTLAGTHRLRSTQAHDRRSHEPLPTSSSSPGLRRGRACRVARGCRVAGRPCPCVGRPRKDREMSDHVYACPTCFAEDEEVGVLMARVETLTAERDVLLEAVAWYAALGKHPAADEWDGKGHGARARAALDRTER